MAIEPIIANTAGKDVQNARRQVPGTTWDYRPQVALPGSSAKAATRTPLGGARAAACTPRHDGAGRHALLDSWRVPLPDGPDTRRSLRRLPTPEQPHGDQQRGNTAGKPPGLDGKRLQVLLVGEVHSCADDTHGRAGGRKRPMKA